MPIADICNRELISLKREATVIEACNTMRHFHVGAILIVEEKNGKSLPIGMVTDRDIVVGVMAPELDPNVMTVGDIMTSNLTVISKSSGVFEAIQLMASKGIRRLPVVDKNQALAGMVTLDDLLLMLSKEFCNVSQLLSKEQKNETKQRK